MTETDWFIELINCSIEIIVSRGIIVGVPDKEGFFDWLIDWLTEWNWLIERIVVEKSGYTDDVAIN